MTDAVILNYFALSILVITFLALIFLIYVWLYNRKGIRFLNRMRIVVTEEGSSEELNELETQDITALVKLDPIIVYEIFITIIILGVNAMTYMYTLVPEAQLHAESAWGILTYISSIGTAYILLNFHSLKKIIWRIDAICVSYNLLIESYKHMKEYEEKEK